MFGFAYRCAGAEFLFFVLQCRADECGEERVRLQRLGFEFWMELAAEEPRVVRGLDNLDVIFIRRAPSDAQSRGDKCLLVVAVKFVAVAVALANFQISLSFVRERSRLPP